MTVEQAGFWPLQVIRGRDLVISFYVDVNIESWAGKAQIRETASPTSDLLAEFAVDIGDYRLQTGNDDVGFMATPITLTLTKTQTAPITVDTGYWDMVLTDSSGVIDSYVVGPVSISDYPTVVT